MYKFRYILPILLVLSIAIALQIEEKTPQQTTDKTTKAPTVESNSRSSVRKPKPALGIGVTHDAIGQLWLAKVENQRLLVYQSDDNGESFSDPIVVTPRPENISADGENRPKIVVDSNNGSVFLTWTVVMPKKYSGDIRFSRSTDSGKTFSTPITLNDDGRITSHRFDSLAIDGKGGVIVAWLDARDREAAKEKGKKYSGISISSAQSIDNGASFSANRTLHEHVCECCRISLAWPTSGPIIFWRNIFGINTRDFAISNLDKWKVRRVTDDEWQVDACPHHGGDMAIDSQGRIHLVWFTNGKTRQGLFYKNIEGEHESLPMAIGNSDAGASHPSVYAAGKTVLITWREISGNSVLAQTMYSTNGGMSWSKPLSLAKTKEAADYPIPIVHEKQMLVIWNTAAEGLRVFPIQATSKTKNLAMR